MANRLAGGDLPGLLAQLRGEGLSWDDIGRRLHVDHGVEVSAETLRRWAADLGIEPKEAVA